MSNLIRKNSLMEIIKRKDGNQSLFLQRIDELKTENAIYLYGAGGRGEWFNTLLLNNDIKVTAFLDSDIRKQGNLVAGVTILSIDDIKNEQTEALVIICINNNKAQKTIIDNLRARGFTKIILYSEVWNKFFLAPEQDIYDILDGEKILQVASLWHDEKSIALYEEILKFYTNHNYTIKIEADNGNQYFPDDVNSHKNYSRMIDCGAYIGDTLMDLQQRVGKVDAIVAFEPDMDNFFKLKNYIQTSGKLLSDDIFIYPCGVWSKTTQLKFMEGNGAGSAISSDGATVLQCVAIDDVLVNFNPTFIKMDVEGAEYEALLGAKNLIQANKPDLAICLYHNIDHLWEIPLLINSWDLGYKFSIREHDYTLEIVMYATCKE